MKSLATRAHVDAALALGRGGASRVGSSPLFAKSAAARGHRGWKLDRFSPSLLPPSRLPASKRTLSFRRKLSLTSTPLSPPTCRFQTASPDASVPLDRCYDTPHPSTSVQSCCLSAGTDINRAFHLALDAWNVLLKA